MQLHESQAQHTSELSFSAAKLLFTLGLGINEKDGEGDGRIGLGRENESERQGETNISPYSLLSFSFSPGPPPHFCTDTLVRATFHFADLSTLPLLTLLL